MSVERGTQLFAIGRHALAMQEFRAALVEDPSNALAHAMLALCLAKERNFADATQEAQQAITLRPDWSFAFYTLASILDEREHTREALAAVEHAISLDPFNPSQLGLLAGLRLKQRNWQAALDAADRGLAIQPDHPLCLNIRGIALVNLGRRSEAAQTIEGALARDPESAVSHANQGWALLHSNDHRAALIHFREALRIDPNLSWAKAGIVEALKARNILYRVMLRYFLLMSRLSSRAQWGVVVGGWVGYQILRSAQASHPEIKPFALPLLVLYAVFALLTWLAAPAFNLMLRIDRFGRYALSPDQARAANAFGAIMLAAAALAVWGFCADADAALPAALYCALLAIPVTAIFVCAPGWPRRLIAACSALLALLALSIVAMLLLFPVADDTTHAIFNFLLDAYLFAFIGAMVAINIVAAARVKR